MKSPVPMLHRSSAPLFLTVVLTALLSALLPARAQAPGTLDTLNADVAGADVDLPDEYVRTAVMQPDGKIIIAGQFSTIQRVPRRNIARLNADGTLDTAFDVGTNQWVYSVVVQPDGKIVIGGHFTVVKPAKTAQEVTRNYVARLNPDGTLDTSFDVGTNYDVTSIAYQPDGQLILGGYFTMARSAGNPVMQARKYLARVTPAGNLDPEFSFQPTDYVYCVTVQEDGKIIVGGKFLNLNARFIVRMNADLTLDPTFRPTLNGPVNCIAVMPDGRVLLGGGFTAVASTGSTTPVVRNRIVRLNAGAVVDTAFNPNSNGFVECMAVQTDNRVVLGGSFTTLQPNGALNPTERLGLARVNADGTLDGTFNPKPDNDVTSVTMQPDGKILAGGYFTKFQAGAKRACFARLYNSQVTDTLTLPAADQILWTRSGALQEVEQVQFDQSTDGGASWTPLGPGTRVPTTSNWQLATGAPLPESFLLRARGRAGSGIRGSGILQTTERFGQTPLEEWNVLWFGSPESTGPAAPDQDPNGNSIPNLLEYALGGDPTGTTTGTAILPVVTRNEGTGLLNLTFNRYPARDDITLTVQAADDVAGPWEDAAQSTGGAAFVLLVPEYAVSETGAGETRTVTFSDKITADPQKRFLRLKVTGPTPAPAAL